MALHHRHTTGKGEHVDVSAQEVVARILEFHAVNWDMLKVLLAREQRIGSIVDRTIMWPCRDGYIIWLYFGGQSAQWTQRLVEWIESEGMADDFLKKLDWETLDFSTLTQEDIDRIEAPMRTFFMAHTKEELHKGALERHVMIFPVHTTADTLESAQLAARGFWVSMQHPELGTDITYPGAFAHASEIPPEISHRAPLIGEHNKEVYEKELGFSREEIVILKQAGVI